ncbi:hypothetical protein M422DRAFT_254841 [Sphaerobolus stellatus SS14]|uniref:Uncharacterized protein n=1 Tax=Sphaerobolus stellatus (strain SS14) TaxID=990650 RepID=A0A0C9VKE3_SPHS4|nr:hypothetical protein M422DRAFT_254841 [Sphaerobolus stellatus SS14]
MFQPGFTSAFISFNVSFYSNKLYLKNIVLSHWISSHSHSAPKRNDKELDQSTSHIQQNYTESTDVLESQKKLQAAISLLATSDLQGSCAPMVSVQLFPGRSPSTVEVSIGIEGYVLEDEIIESLKSVVGKCVNFVKSYRTGLYKSSQLRYRHPVNDFIIDELLPSIVGHHSLALFDTLPAQYRDLSKAWN